MTKKTQAAVEEEAVQEEQEVQVGMSINEDGEVVVKMTTDAPGPDVVDAETGEEIIEGEAVEIDTTEEKVGEATDTPPVQTEMFVKSELDDATAVLKHLKAEQKKRLKAVDTAESNLAEIEERVEEQERVISRIQSQLPPAEPTPEAETETNDGLCRGEDCPFYTFADGPGGDEQYHCESLQSDLNIVVAGQTPCPEVGKEEEPEAEVVDEEVPESDVEIQMDESDEDWMQDGEDEDGDQE
jgi:hypothetical protein